MQKLLDLCKFLLTQIILCF